MSVVEELHLIQVGPRVVPSDADMAPRFGLGKLQIFAIPLCGGGDCVRTSVRAESGSDDNCY